MTQEPATRTRSRPPAPEAQSTPHPRNASAYNVTRRVGGRSVVIGRVCPTSAGKEAFAFADGQWPALGVFPDTVGALGAITARKS